MSSCARVGAGVHDADRDPGARRDAATPPDRPCRRPRSRPGRPSARCSPRPHRLAQKVSAPRAACADAPASGCAQRTSGSERSSLRASAARSAGTVTTSVSDSRRLRSCVTPASARTSARSAVLSPWSRRTIRSTVSAACAAVGAVAITAASTHRAANRTVLEPTTSTSRLIGEWGHGCTGLDRGTSAQGFNAQTPPERGLYDLLAIGAPRFEPGTSPTRTVRATRLRHAPRRQQSSRLACR